MKKYSTTLITIFILVAVPAYVFASEYLNQANQAFSQNDFKSALKLYEHAFQDLKKMSDGDKNSHKNNSHGNDEDDDELVESLDQVAAYIRLQMGLCYLQLGDEKKATAMFKKGASVGKDFQIGNRCLYEEAFWQMYRGKYSDAYEGFNQYVKNIGTDESTYAYPQAPAAMYYTLVNSWFLRSITKGLISVNLVKNILPNTDKKLSFK